MTLQLNNDNGNNVRLDYVDGVSTDHRITFPEADGTVNLVERPGNIIQIVTASTDVQVQVTNAVFTDIGLSVNITPQYADSILIINASIQMSTSRNSENTGAGLRLKRGNATIWQDVTSATGPIGMYQGVSGSAFNAHYTYQPVMYFDTTHNSTAELTYHFEGRPYEAADSGLVNFQTAGTVKNGQSCMTIMEVKA